MANRKIEILTKINNYCKMDGVDPLTILHLENVVNQYPTYNLYCCEMGWVKGKLVKLNIETTPILKWLYHNTIIDGDPTHNSQVIRDFIKKHLDTLNN